MIPTLRESTGVGGAHTERGNEIVQRLDAPQFFRGQADDLAEAAVRGANFLLCPEEHHAFLEPFNDFRDLTEAVHGLPILIAFGQAFEEDAQPFVVEKRAWRRTRPPLRSCASGRTSLLVSGPWAAGKTFCSQACTRETSVMENSSAKTPEGSPARAVWSEHVLLPSNRARAPSLACAMLPSARTTTVAARTAASKVWCRNSSPAPPSLCFWRNSAELASAARSSKRSPATRDALPRRMPATNTPRLSPAASRGKAITRATSP